MRHLAIHLTLFQVMPAFFSQRGNNQLLRFGIKGFGIVMKINRSQQRFVLLDDLHLFKIQQVPGDDGPSQALFDSIDKAVDIA